MEKDWKFIDKWSKKIRAINLLGGKCEKCGNDNIFQLTFHHKKDKEYTIGQLFNKNYRWSIILNEIKKCELLCDNCHQKIHYKDDVIDDSLRKNKNLYLEYKGQVCEKCGYDECISSLSFHHLYDKSFQISTHRIRYIKDLDEYIKNELDKCMILCENCHHLEHSDIKRFDELKVKIYEKIKTYKEVRQKISREQVYEMYESGMKQIEISKHFNASKSTISGIIKTYNKNRC